MTIKENSNIEVECRALLTEDEYNALEQRLMAEAEDLGADDKKVWFYVLPDKLLKVTDNISQGSAKITLKLNRIGQGSAFPELEFPIAEIDTPKAVQMFEQLGYEAMLEPIIRRHNFNYKGVELALKYSGSWQYHMELEQIISEHSQRAAAEERIQQVAKDLGVKIMTEAELAAYDKVKIADYLKNNPKV